MYLIALCGWYLKLAKLCTNVCEESFNPVILSTFMASGYTTLQYLDT